METDSNATRQSSQGISNDKFSLKTIIKYFSFSLAAYIVFVILMHVLFIATTTNIEGIKTFLCFPNDWFLAGLVIGALYVFVALFYFYNYYFRPSSEQEKKEPDEDKSLHNFFYLTIEWFVPVLIINIFIFLGFFMTVKETPFNVESTVFTHPYKYGLIYRQFNEELNNAKNQNSIDYQTTKQQLYEKYSPYIRQDILDVTGQAKDKSIIQFICSTSKIVDPGLCNQTKNLDQCRKNIQFQRIEMCIYSIPFLIALSFGFLGALIYSLKDIAFRYFIGDLYSKTLVGYIIRFLFAPVLCLVIAYYVMENWWVSTAPIVFFIIGFFPEWGMQFIQEQARKLLGITKDKTSDLPLSLIVGMTDYLVYRFREIGIDDVQNLAFADLKYLRKNLGYSSRRVLYDFISQAILIILLKDHVDTLRSFGIRDIISFKNTIKEDTYEEKAKFMNVPAVKLLDVINVIKSDHFNIRITNMEEAIKEYEKEKKDNWTAKLWT